MGRLLDTLAPHLIVVRDGEGVLIDGDRGVFLVPARVLVEGGIVGDMDALGDRVVETVHL